MSNIEEEIIPYKPIRLDAYLMEQYPELGRSRIQRLVKDGKVLVNSEPQRKNGYMVKEKTIVSVDFDFDAKVTIPDIELPVLYEDESCVVMNKPLGVLTHSKGVYNPEASVATWLAQRPSFAFADNEDEENQRQGIVHRLDRATSGVMICAKNPEALRHLQKQFQDRKAKKTYVARIAGEISPKEALIDLPIERNPRQPQMFRVGQNGKPSQTNYKVLQTIEQNDTVDSILELKPTTGRTHQLRVHLDYMKHPIVGDTFYEGRSAERLFLHAHQLEITLPNKRRQTFTAPVPEIFYKSNL